MPPTYEFKSVPEHLKSPTFAAIIGPTGSSPFDNKHATLYDNAMAGAAGALPWLVDPTKEAESARQYKTHFVEPLRQAQPVVATDALVRSCVHLAHDYPEAIVHGFDRLRLPFPVTWVEWDHHTYLTMQNTTEASDSLDQLPRRVGVLLREMKKGDGWQLTWVRDRIGQNLDFHIGGVGVVVSLNEPFHVASDPGVEVPYFFGYAYNGRADLFRKLCPHLGFIETCTMTSLRKRGVLKGTDVNTLMASEIREQSGGWLFVAALLTALHSQDRIVTTGVPKPVGRRLINRRSVPYYSHRVVTIALPKRQRLSSPEADWAREVAVIMRRRRHAVMGHWCREQGTGDYRCMHAWEPAPKPRHGEVCSRCGWHRWWREACERGDASIGYVRRETLLTTRNNHQQE